MNNIYVVRHGESMDNINHVFSGWRDSKLAPKGKQTANLLAKRLKGKRIDLAFSSDQSRALDTAKTILKFHKGVPIIIDARLRERNYGALNGKSKDEFEKKNPKLYAIYHRSYNKAPPKGESLKMVVNRVTPFVHDLLSILKEFNCNVLISAHGNSIRGIRKYFEKLSEHKTRTIENAHDKIWHYRV
jgi:2,3-bisphosphoglycerate-dependent phosphoglycerate mutase